MNMQQITETAKAQNWKRSQVKAACYEHQVPVESREAIYAALGMAPTGPAPTAKPAEVVAAVPAPAPIAVSKPRGVMTLKWAATDFLTGETLPAGSDAVGVKLGGKWDFTAAAGINQIEAKKALELLLLSMGDDEGGPDGALDHNDFRDLLYFGQRFPYYAARIAVEVPGLGN